jgi:hypothetical protein
MVMTDDKVTSRRSALRGGLAAIAAGLAVPALASTKPDDDAQLIRLCDRLVQLRTYEIAELSSDDYDEDNLVENDREWDAIVPRVRQIDRPLTLAGAAAMGRCVVRHCSTCRDGEVYTEIDLAKWMTIRVSEFLAGEVPPWNDGREQ